MFSTGTHAFDVLDFTDIGDGEQIVIAELAAPRILERILPQRDGGASPMQSGYCSRCCSEPLHRLASQTGGHRPPLQLGSRTVGALYESPIRSRHARFVRSCYATAELQPTEEHDMSRTFGRLGAIRMLARADLNSWCYHLSECTAGSAARSRRASLSASATSGTSSPISISRSDSTAMCSALRLRARFRTARMRRSQNSATPRAAVARGRAPGAGTGNGRGAHRIQGHRAQGAGARVSTIPGAANLALRIRNLDGLFPKIAAYPGVKILSKGGKPVTITTPNGTLHAVFVQDPDGFVVEMLDAANPPADAPAGAVIAGSSFEAAVRNSEATVKFYNELLGFDLRLGASFNDNQDMASTAGAPGASFRQSTARIPGTAVPFTLIEFKNIERKELSGRTQDPGTTVLQLIVRDVTALTAKLRAAGVPIVTTGGEPVQVAPGLKIAIVKDPNNLLLELAERSPR